MDPRIITPLLIAALVIWSIYRRTRRAFGRQRVSPRRMGYRIGIFTLLSVLALVASAHEMRMLGALAGGLACGAALGYVGLRYTKFEVTAEGRFYTPHTYLGLIVMALLVGRILYRFIAMYSAGHGFAAPFGPAGPHSDPTNPFAYGRSPLTLLIFGAVVGYYVLYYLGVLEKTKARSPTDLTAQ